MHTLRLVKQFIAPSDFVTEGRTYKAGCPVVLYRHEKDGRPFIQLYDGPFFWVKNADYCRRLLTTGHSWEQARALSGFDPAKLHSISAFDKLRLPSEKSLVSAIGSDRLTPVTETFNQTNQTQIDMAKKTNKTTPAAPAAPAAPVAPQAPVVPAAPVEGALLPAPPAPPVESGVPQPPSVPAAPQGAPIAPAAPAAPAEPKPPKDEKNGVTRPGAGTTTRNVWDIADRLTSSTGKPATRGDVIAQATPLGINASTATTQFGKWAKYNGYTGDKSPGRSETAPAGANIPAAPAPGTPPSAPVPPVEMDPAFQTGFEQFKVHASGGTPVNPYQVGTPELERFTAGWQAAHAASVTALVVG